MSDGVDAPLFTALVTALGEAGASYEVIAPTVGGVVASDGSQIPAKQQLPGGPSVLYDAVALLVAEADAATIAALPATRDFVADAFAHHKFIGYVASAEPLLERAGVSAEADAGVVALTTPRSATSFVNACRDLRFWAREL